MYLNRRPSELLVHKTGSFNSLGNLSCHCLGTPAAAASHIYGYLDSSTTQRVSTGDAMETFELEQRKLI